MSELADVDEVVELALGETHLIARRYNPAIGDDFKALYSGTPPPA